MPFNVPNFNLLCNIFTGPVPAAFPGGPPRIANQPCQLRMLKTAEIVRADENVSIFSSMLLAVHNLTDIRMESSALNDADYVEVPSGSTRYYRVGAVDDVAKGFANEYRTATLFSLNLVPGAWHRPYP